MFRYVLGIKYLPRHFRIFELAILSFQLTQNMANFMKSVRLFDYNRDGNLQKRDLIRILESCGIRIQEGQLDK